jgi:hypothetical protein
MLRKKLEGKRNSLREMVSGVGGLKMLNSNSGGGGGGVQLGPLGTSATNSPVVPAPGDYGARAFGGIMIGRGNRSTRRKPTPVQQCPQQIPHDLTRREPGPPRWEASD